MTRSGIESQSPGPLANTLLIRPNSPVFGNSVTTDVKTLDCLRNSNDVFFLLDWFPFKDPTNYS